MTFNRSKEEVTSLASIPSILVALSDSVEWMPSLDCSESSGMSTTLTQSALVFANYFISVICKLNDRKVVT